MNRSSDDRVFGDKYCGSNDLDGAGDNNARATTNHCPNDGISIPCDKCDIADAEDDIIRFVSACRV